jgi:hypothetical protein
LLFTLQIKNRKNYGIANRLLISFYYCFYFE